MELALWTLKKSKMSKCKYCGKAEHISIHSKLRAMKLREKAGKYDKLIGVLKQVKMLEDSNINQQSIDSTTKNLIQQLFDIVGDDIV